MNKSIYLLFLILFLGENVFAHQDFYIFGKHGKVHTKIQTGYQYEEINLVDLIGRKARELASFYNYTEDIFLDFKHAYTHQGIDSDYFVSYDRGELNYTWFGAEKRKPPMKRKCVVIREIGNRFNIKEILQLLEYGMLNKRRIQKDQSKIIYEGFSYHWELNTVDSAVIDSILREEASDAVESVLNQKARYEYGRTNSRIKCYWQDSKFHFHIENSDLVLLELEYLERRANIGTDISMLFGSDSTFYCLKNRNGRGSISQLQELSDVRDLFWPFKIEALEQDKVGISFTRFRHKDEEGKELEAAEDLYLRRYFEYHIESDVLELIESD